MSADGDGYCSRCGRWLPHADLIQGADWLETPFGATQLFECRDSAGCSAWEAESKERKEVLAENLDHRVLYPRPLFPRGK